MHTLRNFQRRDKRSGDRGRYKFGHSVRSSNRMVAWRVCSHLGNGWVVKFYIWHVGTPAPSHALYAEARL